MAPTQMPGEDVWMLMSSSLIGHVLPPKAMVTLSFDEHAVRYANDQLAYEIEEAGQLQPTYGRRNIRHCSLSTVRNPAQSHKSSRHRLRDRR